MSALTHGRAYPPPSVYFTDPNGQPTFRLTQCDDFDPQNPEFVIERETEAGRMEACGAMVAEEGQLIHILLSELAEAWRHCVSCSRDHGYGSVVPSHEIRQRAGLGFGWAFEPDDDGYYNAVTVEPISEDYRNLWLNDA